MSALADRAIGSTVHQLIERGRRATAWPGLLLRAPSYRETHYLHHKRLLLTLAGAFVRYLAPRAPLTLLDVGAGEKPYFPLLEPYVRHYVGLDRIPGRLTDVGGQAEQLPFADGCVDAVLATQVLEHLDDPPAALREWGRVLVPGGLVIASTHGSYLYHPIPVDYWRWTHTGLRRLFEQAGLKVLSLQACERTASVLAMLLAIHAYALAARLHLGSVAQLVLVVLNALVGQLDRVDRAAPQDESELGWGAMPCTFVVVATRPAPGQA
jgi:SAM-dependent methyltransferase